MRSGRSLLIFTAVLGGLLAYLYFVDADRPLGDEEDKPKVFSVEADRIEALRIGTVAGETAELKKEGGAWMMVSPVAATADQSEVSSVTSSLASLAIQRVVDEKPENLGDYGLRDPVVEVSFKAEGDSDYRTLQLGNKTPTGSDMYAKVADEPRVFLVYGYLDTTFNRKPFDLRDKQILSFDRDKVDRLELDREATDVTLVKESGSWALQAPVQGRADFSTVEGLVSRLQSAQMKSIVTEEPGDLTPYELARPAVTATVGAGSARATLAFGGKTDEGDIYVRDTSRPGVFTVGADLLTEIEKPVADFRWKDLFEARPYNTTKVELTRDGATVAFERQQGQGEDGADLWTRSGAEGEADTTKVEALLTTLTGLRAQEFADGAAAGATPALTVRATFDEGSKTEEVEFLRDDGRVYARRGNEPGLAVVETASFEEALKSLGELK